MTPVLSRNHALVKRALAVLVVLALGAGVLALRDPAGSSPPTDRTQPEPDAGSAAVKVHVPTSVSANRAAEVPDGFRGDVHPLLRNRTPLEVTAHWSGLEKDRLKFEAPDEIKSWFTRLHPAVPQVPYTARHFTAFLPVAFEDVGQLWALDSDRVKLMLGQFHPGPSMHLAATGRRAGPDGAYAILRALSPTHADVVFRIHAEFYVTPDDAGPLQPVYAWYTPAYFTGRVLVNKQTGAVEHFRLALPTEKALNVFLTVNPSRLGVPKLAHDIVRVDRMELTGGDPRLADALSWDKSIPPADADRRLARVFYKFEEIDWVPPEQALARAREKNRPVFAIVSWGSTDDQSC